MPLYAKCYNFDLFKNLLFAIEDIKVMSGAKLLGEETGREVLSSKKIYLTNLKT